MNPSWLKFIPADLRARIEHRPHLLKAMSNTGWLFGDHAVRMGVGLIVSVWLARYLGPEQFGLLSYAIAFVALFGAIAGLGLNNIVVRELVKEPQAVGRILGSAFVLLMLGGLLAFGTVVTAIYYLRPDDSLSKLVVILLSLAMLFKSAEVVKYWFESQVESKYAVWVENGAYLIFAGVKVALILEEAPLVAFVWAMLAEGLVAAIGLMVMYAWRGGRLNAWRPHVVRATSLFKDSWPLILTGLAAMVYMRIDQIMLGEMLGDEAVGIYSAAVRISEVWYFVPAAVVASVFPAIVEAKKTNETVYYERLQKLYDLMLLLAVTLAVPLTLLSNYVVFLVFGEAYVGAGSVLAIHVWTNVFVFIGFVGGKWFILEGLTMLTLRRNLYGAVLNVLLNLILIPIWGINGAAAATLASVALSAYLSDSFLLQTRRAFFQKTKSIIGAYQLLRLVLSRRGEKIGTPQ